MKIARNVAFLLFNLGIFHQFLSYVACLVSLFDQKLQFFKNSPKGTIFGIFGSLLATQNVNVARNVECDFFGVVLEGKMQI